jgi:hypothetical protein
VPIWALVPRAIWRDKPAVGGGRTRGADVTGLDDEATSFGAGQVLEFFVNFGWLGVVGGFFLFGALFRWLDDIIIRSLNALEVRKLVLAVLPGFALLQPIGNLLEMLVSGVAAVVAAYALGTFLEMRKVVRLRPQISASSIIR